MHSLEVDIRNPGEFFACCGLLELAGPDAQGWFQDDNFVIDREFDDIIESLKKLSSHPLGSIDTDCKIDLDVGGRLIRLDWWLTNPAAKCWSVGTGDESIFRIINDGTKKSMGLIAALRNPLLWQQNTRLLARSLPETKHIGVNPKTARHTNDYGYKQDTETYVIAEILALIGLQRFQFVPIKNDHVRFDYHIWHKPLYKSVATIAGDCCTDTTKMTFVLVRRSKHVKAYSWAERVSDVIR